MSFLWGLMIFIANPSGEFPLNDDWAYNKSLLTFFDTCELKFVSWSAMTLVSQLFLGSVFCKIFGFSFLMLRILSATIGLMGILFSYKTLRLLNIPVQTSFFISILLLSNPLFFSLSNSFMTDIYFYSFSVISFFFIVKCLNDGKLIWLILVTLFIITATMVRQIGVLITIPFLIVFLIRFGYRDIRTVLKAITPFALTLIALLFFNDWLNQTNKQVTTYFSIGTAVSEMGFKTLEHLFYRIGTAGMTLGFFLFPLLILNLSDFKKSFLKKENRISLILTVVFIIPLVRAWTNIPFGNIFYDLGLGPKLLKDTYLLGINSFPTLQNTGLLILRSICLIGGILLYYQCFNFIFKMKFFIKEKTDLPVHHYFKLFSLLLILFLSASFAIPDFFFDRYLIQLLFLISVVLIPLKHNLLRSKYTLRFSYILISLFIVFSVTATHDYFSWNRARWKGLDYLTKNKKIYPSEIDGGFEFNGWHQTGIYEENQTKSWWFVNQDTYIIAFGPIDGYNVIKMIPYRQHISFRTGHIYILEKRIKMDNDS